METKSYLLARLEEKTKKIRKLHTPFFIHIIIIKSYTNKVLLNMKHMPLKNLT